MDRRAWAVQSRLVELCIAAAERDGGEEADLAGREPRPPREPAGLRWRRRLEEAGHRLEPQGGELACS
eukprot:9133856-Lingulodinium_polyedra.AAC.1